MPPSTYVARLPGPFAALAQAAQIGGFRLEPLLSTRVRDRFYDTDDGALLRAGRAVRVREQDGAVTAGLRALGPAAEEPLPRDVALRASPGGALDLDGSPFAPAVRDVAGTTRLRTLLALRQYRTPRIASDGGRHLALVSFDVVVYEVPGGEVTSNEVEVERAGAGTDRDLERLGDALRATGLEPARRTKLERGVLLLPRALSEPVLLLPDEARRLAALADGGDPRLAPLARVVLLDARGFRADTISGRTGVGAVRARQWKALFREKRMAAFDEAARPPAPRPPLALASPPRRAATAPPRPAPPRPVPRADEAAARAAPGGGERAGGVPSPDRPLASREAAAVAPAEVGPPPLGRPRLAGRGGAPEARSAPQDMDDLLDLFRSVETETPLLDDEDDGPPRPAIERIVGWGDGRGGGGEVEDPERPPPSRSGDTPVLRAASETVAVHVGRCESAARAFRASSSLADARGLVSAAHGLRLALLSFRWVLPEHAADRLVGALRPVVVDLEAAVDYDRAGAEAGDGAGRFEAARRRALASAHSAVGAEPWAAWSARAGRLVARLDAQAEAGLAVGDDVAAPPADFVGPSGPPAVPSRLRHVLGSMLWRRYEAVRAFEDASGERPETAEHFASALRALRFALDLAADASDGPARDLAAALADAEARVTAERDRRRTAGLLGVPSPAPTAVRDEGRAFAERAFRERLAAVAVGV